MILKQSHGPTVWKLRSHNIQKSPYHNSPLLASLCVCSYLSVLPLKRSHLIMENLHLWGGSVAAAASAGIELASTDYSGNMILQNWKQWVNVIFRPCLISNCAITRLRNIQCGFHTVFSNYHFNQFMMKQGMNVVRISALSGLNEILVHFWIYDRTWILQIEGEIGQSMQILYFTSQRQTEVNKAKQK